MTPRHRAARRRAIVREELALFWEDLGQHFQKLGAGFRSALENYDSALQSHDRKHHELQQFLRRLALGRRWVGDHEVSDSAANRHAFGDVGGADLGHEGGLAHSSSPSLCFDRRARGSYSSSPLGPSSVWSWIRTRSGPVRVTAEPGCAWCTALCSTSNVV